MFEELDKKRIRILNELKRKISIEKCNCYVIKADGKVVVKDGQKIVERLYEDVWNIWEKAKKNGLK